jgi:hypothetical protein
MAPSNRLGMASSNPPSHSASEITIRSSASSRSLRFIESREKAERPLQRRGGESAEAATGGVWQASADLPLRDCSSVPFRNSASSRSLRLIESREKAERPLQRRDGESAEAPTGGVWQASADLPLRDCSSVPFRNSASSQSLRLIESPEKAERPLQRRGGESAEAHPGYRGNFGLSFFSLCLNRRLPTSRKPGRSPPAGK